MDSIETNEIRIKINEDQSSNELFGNLDANLTILSDNYEAEIIQRQDEIILRGRDAAKAAEVIEELRSIVSTGETLDAQKINYVISLKEKGLSYKDNNVNRDVLCYTHRGKPVKPKTMGQTAYAKSIRERDIVLGSGRPEQARPISR